MKIIKAKITKDSTLVATYKDENGTTLSLIHICQLLLSKIKSLSKSFQIVHITNILSL